MECTSLLLVLGIVANWPSPRPAVADWAVPYDELPADWAMPGDVQMASAAVSIPPGELGCRAPAASADPLCLRRACRCPVWEACIEFTVLKPRFEDGAEEEWRGDVVDFHLRPAPRVWISCAQPDGWTLRTRYWQFDHASDSKWVVQVPDLPYRVFAQVEAHTIDLELAQEWRFDRWSLLVGGGARYASIQQTIQATDSPDRWFKRLEAIGPTFVLEGQRVTRVPCFSWFANFRGSLLSGKARYANPAEFQDTDDIGSILEMQIGGELNWQLPCRGALFLRSGWEQQIWLGAGSFFGAAGAPVAEILDVKPDDHDLGFMGFFVSLGADW